MPTLGQQLKELIDQQMALREATTDPSENDKIQVRIEHLNKQFDRLIDYSWDQTRPEYQEVVSRLSEATEALRNARKGLMEIDHALKLVDMAVSSLALLFAMAGPHTPGDHPKKD